MKKKAAGEKIRIKQIKSSLGYTKDQIGTVKALGLKRLNQEIEINDNPVSRGMIFKVKHLVKVIWYFVVLR